MEDYLPVPLKYTRPIIMTFRYKAKSGSYENLTYFPELGSWITRKKILLDRLKYRNLTYNEWFSRWFVDIDPSEFGSETWALKFVNIRYQDKLPDTKRFIKIQLLKDPKNYECDFLMTRLDFINLYKETRLKIGRKLLDIDFSITPEIIKSTSQKVKINILNINPKTGYPVGEVLVNYGHFISECRDPSISPQNKDFSFLKSEFYKKLQNIDNGKYDYSEVVYVNSTTPIKIFCNSCKEYFYQTPVNHLQGCGCPTCGNKKDTLFDWDSEKDNIEKYIQDGLSLEEIGKIYGITGHQVGVIVKRLNLPSIFEYHKERDLKIYSEMLSKKMTLKEMAECLDVTISSVSSKLQYLNLEYSNSDLQSQDEKYIVKFLKENNIVSYNTQVKFSDIKGRKTNNVFIDFIIDYNNKHFVIEYNGRQHYEYTKFFHRSLEDFTRQKERDINVRNYFMSKENYVYIEIPYTYSSYNDIKDLLENIIIGDNKPNIDLNNLYN